MAYVKVNWAAGVTPLSEGNMDHLETQYDEASTDLTTHLTNAGAPGVHRWTAARLLLGAGAGADPTELAVPRTVIFLPMSDVVGGTATRTQIGDHPGTLIDAAAEIAYGEFRIPHDFTSITSALLVGISQWTPGANKLVTYPMLIDIDTDYGALDEAYNAHSDAGASKDNVEAHSTVSDLISWDISTELSSIAVNDYVGIKATYRAGVPDSKNETEVLIVGVLLRYS